MTTLCEKVYNWLMDLKNTLLEFGFNSNEVAVYLSLLKLGLTQAGPIVKETKLHRMIVYNALNRLVDERLATIVHKKNVQLFQATDPVAISEKMARLSVMAKGAVSALRELQKSHDSVVDVRTLVGHEGFILNLQDIIESASRQSDKTMSTIGGAPDRDFYEAIADWYPNYLDLLAKRKVFKKLIAPASYAKIFRKKFVNENRTELRLMPKGLSSPTYTRITREMVSIEMYKPQLLVIQIRNPAIAESYLDSFKLLWENGQRI